MNKILVVNGPNINMLGIRELDKYGQTSYQELKDIIQNHAIDKFHIEIYQSNVEGEIVSKVHNIIEEDFEGLIINPGAYTHTSIAIRDALAILKIPVVEVHISDIKNREDFRQVNLIRDLCDFTLSGKGIDGYIEAIDYLYEKY
uniref:3-dehydroquinate dehydratase n=1 Tax=Candidatus Actinomarina minuta TaxID=1389454 RepID=S5DWW5_9ACTN|nr:3-dehydroquinate dehydratase II [Candidatus Actinomarina minuta]